MKKLGFVVNPVAGMGGAVGLKGTNGDAYFKALKLDAEPVTPQRAEQFLSDIKSRGELLILSAPSVMGEKMVKKTGIEYRVVGLLEGKEKTSAEDTRRIVKEMMKKDIDLLVFVGGDGTSRDIYDVVGLDKPVLGVPSG